MLSTLRLIPQPPGEIVSGEAIFQGRDLLQLSREELRHVRGGQIGFVFQDPMTSFNPVQTIGKQLMEPLEIHLGMNKKQPGSRG
jgi:ABC-type microcin C transport system duplicated ATPase subunit YejF